MHGAEHRTALVTGATGFIGSHLLRRLLRDGWNVHVMSRPTSSTDALGDAIGRVCLHPHDGTTEHLCEIVARSRPQVVFHLASHFVAQHRTGEVGTLVQSNIQLSAQLVEAMVVNGVFRLVNTGTAWQHYNDAPYDPVCLYAATKQAFEAILTYYVHASPLVAVTLKLFDTYGPGDRRRKLLTLLSEAAESGEPLSMSPGEQRLDLVHIDDVVEAFILAAERLLTGRVQGHESYAVSSGTPLSLRELVSRYARGAGRDLPILWGGRPYREREVMVPWSSGEPLPGWEPKISLDEGLRRLASAAERAA